MLELNRRRLGAGRSRYVQADLFGWRPDSRYDVVFFSFWLSHDPPERLAGFWELVRACSAPGGRVFFVDSRYNEAATAVDHRLEGLEGVILTRRLNDGREFRIVKLYYDPADLERRLADLGWCVTARETANHFLYGWGAIDSPAP